MTSIQYPHIPFSYTWCSALCKKGDKGMREMMEMRWGMTEEQGAKTELCKKNLNFIPTIPPISISPFLTLGARLCVRREMWG